MKWPWVNREVLEDRDAAYQRSLADLSASLGKQLVEAQVRYSDVLGELRASAVRYDNLLAKYHALRVQGANEPEPKPVAVPAEPLDPVVAAVNAMAPDVRSRSSMLRQVAVDRVMRVPDAEIVMRIQRGTRPAEALG